MRNYITLLSILFFTALLHAQYQHPTRMKWIKLETPHFKIIAPKTITQEAIKTADLMEHIQQPVSNSLIDPYKKLSLFLFNQNAMSNGYVALAPTYSAYYTTPFQDASVVGGTDWIQTLALHEYRHYVQFNKLDNGLTYIGGSLLGDLGKGFFMNWSVPAWFFEGDAICSETALSAGGRGRLPSFLRDIRALEIENTRYKYDEAYLGSYKTYFPNHYHLGYLMSSGIRKQYGIEAWNKAINKSYKISIWPYAFSAGLGSYAGGRMKKSYNLALNDYDSVWTERSYDHNTTAFEKPEVHNKFYTNYDYPFRTADGDIVCLKSGMAESSQLVRISDYGEEVLAQIYPYDRMHSNGEKIVWSTFVSDVRWAERSYCDVVVYDISSGKKKRITHGKKYFAPAISPMGDQIAVLEYTDRLRCSIVILNARNGSKIKSIAVDENFFARMPSWSEDQTRLVFTVTEGQKMAVFALDIETEKFIEILPFTHQNITSPIFYKNYVLYNSPEQGIDMILAYDTLSKEKRVVVSGDYGVYDAALSMVDETIVFKDYSTKGFSPGFVKLKPKEWLSVDKYSNVHDNYYKALVEQEGFGNIFENYTPDSTVNYEIKKYRPLLKSIKIHSWQPYTSHNGGVGLAVYSNDMLNTLAAAASVEYYPDKHTSLGTLELSYAGLYPIIDAGITYGGLEEPHTDSTYRALNEKILSLGFHLPLNFSYNVWQTQLQIGASYNYVYQNYSQVNTGINDLPPDQEFSALYFGGTFLNYRQSALRDINPRFGQEIGIHYWNTPFKDQVNGSRLSVAATLYFPGLFKHHSAELQGAYQGNFDGYTGGLYTAATDVLFVRGYDYPIPMFDKFYNAKAIYTLPLIHPDFSAGPVLYLKRVYSSFFYDFGLTQYNTNTSYTKYQSVGADLNFDFHIFRLLPLPLRMGLRYSYLIDENGHKVEFLLSGVAF